MPAAFAAPATRSASAMTSATGEPVSVASSTLLHVDDDRLEVGHLLDGAVAANPADATFLAGAAAKRNMGFPIIGRFVDVHPACLQPLGEAEGAIDVPRVHRSQQAIG